MRFCPLTRHVARPLDVDLRFRVSERSQTLGEAHRDGLLRGIVFIMMLAIPFGLTFGPGALQSAKARFVVSPGADASLASSRRSS